MSDPTVQGAAATASLATGALTVAGSLYGIPADVLLASILGAALALGQADKKSINWSTLLSMLHIFALSLATAIFVGPVAVAVTHKLALSWAGIDLNEQHLRVGVSFLLSLGAQHWLPAIFSLLKWRFGPKPPPHYPHDRRRH